MESDANQDRDRNESPITDENSNITHSDQERDRTKAINLFLSDLMKLFHRGVAMGFLEKRGDNYHWNLDGNENNQT